MPNSLVSRVCVPVLGRGTGWTCANENPLPPPEHRWGEGGAAQAALVRPFQSRGQQTQRWLHPRLNVPAHLWLGFQLQARVLPGDVSLLSFFLILKNKKETD